MKKKLLAGLATGLMIMGMTEMANATLTTIGTAGYNGQSYNLIWDDNNNGKSVVWLDYTNDYTDWNGQTAWASGLNTGGVLSYNLSSGYSIDFGANTWRLPTSGNGVSVWTGGYNGTGTVGYNITSSELGHLFYAELGNLGEKSKTTGEYLPEFRLSEVGLTKVGDFDHLSGVYYWSGTELESAASGKAWSFYTMTGYQGVYEKYSNMYGLALCTGQVTYTDPNAPPAPVPEPATMILLGTGLAGLVASRRKKKA